MPRISRATEQAFLDGWAEYDVIPDEVQKQQINTFKRRWKGLNSNAFKRALQEGDDADRLFARFALGYLAPSGFEDLLTPFLSAPTSKERWASAISLGRRKDERVFALLGQLLLERMESLTLGKEYEWYMRHRRTIISILRDWNDPRAILVLRQALQKCMSLEQLSRSQDDPSLHVLEDLYWLEDELAYALGALEAWNSLDGLDLPASRLKLARLYLIFGSLHLNLPSLSADTITLLLRTGTLARQQIANVLQNRFGEESHIARAAVGLFEHWYQQRTEAQRQQFEQCIPTHDLGYVTICTPGHESVCYHQENH